MSHKKQNTYLELSKQFLKNLSLDIAQVSSTSFEELINGLKNEVGSKFNLSRDSAERILKIAWNYNEKNCEEYSLEEAIKWFKLNLPKNASGGVLLKIASTNSGELKLHHCFIDTDENPLLDGSYPHLVVNVLKLSENLGNQFGDKDMIILK
jgi:hypothetical protein